MTLPLPKRGEIRLQGEEYEELRQRILRRDGWRCQGCGRSEKLQIHHIEPRSHVRKDAEQNLVTLCARCHRKIHHNA